MAIMFMKIDTNCDGTVDWVSKPAKLIHMDMYIQGRHEGETTGAVCPGSPDPFIVGAQVLHCCPGPTKTS